MKIGGVSKGSGDKKALLGSLILKPGNTLPPILNNQIETLRVLSVGDASVVLEFVEKAATVASRKIVLLFGIKREVRQFMSGEAVEELITAGVPEPPKLGKAAYPGDPQARSILTNIQEAEQKRSSDKLMGVFPDAKNP
ncbi:MAG: hypothetical protein WCQ57_17035 [Verrucomicrobiota bacterium]